MPLTRLNNNSVASITALPSASTSQFLTSNSDIAALIPKGYGVRQIVVATQTVNTTTNTYSWNDLLTCSITLASANSKVIVCGVLMGGANDHGGSRVTRNGTQIPYSGAPGRGSSLKSITPSSYSSSFGNNSLLGGGFTIYDAPGQTSNTYKLQVACGPSGSPSTFNIGYNTSGSSAYFDAVNYLQVIELI